MRLLLHCMLSALVIIATMSISGELLLMSRKFDSERSNFDLIPKLDYLSTQNELGVVHTLRNYIQWHIKEEKLVNLFGSRIMQLRIQYKLIKRFFHKIHKHLHKFKPKIFYSVWKENLPTIFTAVEILGNRFSQNNWIGNEDLIISLTGILHLQNVYSVPASKMSIGLNFDSNFGGFLTQFEMVLHGLHSLSKSLYVTAISWLQEATFLKNKKLSPDLLHSIFIIGMQSHNLKYSRQASTNEQLSNIRNDSFDDLYLAPILNGLLPPEEFSNRMVHFNKYRGIDPNVRFADICNGRSLQSTNQVSKPYCYSDNRKHPYLYINPMKVEQLSVNPLILQFYEIMRNNTIETIVQEVGLHVTTLNLWFDDENFAYGKPPVSVTNSARMGINFGNISKATQLLTRIMSGLTVWNGPNHNRYGEHVYGRHFNLHNDGLQTKPINETPKDNDIMATMVFYLRVSKMGGCTAFVHAGVCSRKVPGSAVFWYNMYKNGSYTTELKHGSCPVVHGEKIAISLFLKHNANWKKRPCSVDQFV